MNLSIFNSLNFTPKSILDIGCNIGQFYNCCRNIWHDVEIRYTLIDGNNNVEDDLKNLNVEYYITVLSDRIKKVIWYGTNENPKCTGDSYYRELTKHYSDTNVILIEKTTNTLDVLLKDRVYDLIKIDTQGSEVDIIKGGIDICKKAKYLILETSLIEYNENAPMKDEVTGYLKLLGFIPVTILDVHYLNGSKSQLDILYENSFPQ